MTNVDLEVFESFQEERPSRNFDKGFTDCSLHDSYNFQNSFIYKKTFIKNCVIQQYHLVNSVKNLINNFPYSLVEKMELAISK